MKASRAWTIAVLAVLLSSLQPFAFAEPEDSYANLAARVVPDKLRTALKLLPTLSADTGPGEVKALRVSLLEAREQLDVFSFAFPNRVRSAEPLAEADVLTAWGRVKAALGQILREIIDWINRHVADTGIRIQAPVQAVDVEEGGAAGTQGQQQQLLLMQGQQGQQGDGGEGLGRHHRRRKERDLWFDVRADLDEGYEVLGDFQDLDHSLVEYNETDLQEKRAVCLDWQRRIQHHSAADDYLEFVSSPLHSDELFKHKHSSKLFWGYHGVSPDTSLSGIRNLALMVRSSQLAQLLEWYPNVTALHPDDLLQDPGHTTFHNFRKLIRSILAVLLEFPELLGPGRKTASALGDAAAQAVGATAAAAAAGDAALAGARRALFATTSSSSGSSSTGARPSSGLLQLHPLLQQLLRGGGASSAGSRGPVLDPADPGCDADGALKAFQRLFHDLGQTNNKIFAYQFYASRGEEWEAQAEEAHQQVAEGWADNLSFMDASQIDKMARCIADTLPRTDPHSRRRRLLF